MARKQDVFTLVGERMHRAPGDAGPRITYADMPPIADLIRRIDRALMERRAA
ncbi:hypothetical protein VH567_15290 [Sphingomonas sp. 4RDLI-65]|uniref:hypothetical protein n=1 Tax=Sphingomonas sp. 4RDLI-65 TaxID=3111641 RepID=UPI003C1D9A41